MNILIFLPFIFVRVFLLFVLTTQFSLKGETSRFPRHTIRESSSTVMYFRHVDVLLFCFSNFARAEKKAVRIVEEEGSQGNEGKRTSKCEGRKEMPPVLSCSLTIFPAFLLLLLLVSSGMRLSMKREQESHVQFVVSLIFITKSFVLICVACFFISLFISLLLSLPLLFSVTSSSASSLYSLSCLSFSLCPPFLCRELQRKSLSVLLIPLFFLFSPIFYFQSLPPPLSSSSSSLFLSLSRLHESFFSFYSSLSSWFCPRKVFLVLVLPVSQSSSLPSDYPSFLMLLWDFLLRTLFHPFSESLFSLMLLSFILCPLWLLLLFMTVSSMFSFLDDDIWPSSRISFVLCPLYLFIFLPLSFLFFGFLPSLVSSLNRKTRDKSFPLWF